jgi:hypothetical protein
MTSMYPSYKDAAARAGLTMSPPEPGIFSSFIELSGESGGHFVRIQRLVGVHTLATHVFFQPPFDLGLNVTPAGQPSWMTGAFPGALRRIGKLFSRADVQVGDAELDDALAVHADEEIRVEVLLHAAREQLLAWFKSEVAFEIDDAGVHVRRYSTMPMQDTPDLILGDLAPALALASRLEAARASVPPALALAPTVARFAAFAAARGLGASQTPLAVWGTLDGFGVWARAVRAGAGTYKVEASLGAATRLTAEGSVTSTHAAEAGAGFDDAFAIEGAWFVSHLTADAKRALAALHASGHDVRLGPAGVTLSAPIGHDAYDLEGALDQAAAAWSAVERAARAG